MRYDDWEIRLTQYVRSVVLRPMEWGVTDCGSLVRDAVAAMYGESPLSIRSYTSLRGARAAWRAVGDPCAYLEDRGARGRVLAFAQIGDITYRPGPDHDGFPVFGICTGARVLAITKDEGVHLAPIELVDHDTTAWRLP